MSKEAMKLALEALESCSGAPHWPALQPVITAVRKALAEQSAPVPWSQALEDVWAEQPAQPTTDTVMQAFTGLPKRKLDMLLSADWRINGVSIEHEEAGVIKRGAVTFGGMVLWWNAPQAPKEKNR